MNEFKGTPGPWEVDGVEIYPVGGHRSAEAICSMYPGFPDADAELIAAAPELVSLLQEARSTLEMWKDLAPAVSLCADIDKVLAKALGEQQ